jgi:lysophospholipase L1-like esterase
MSDERRGGKGDARIRYVALGDSYTIGTSVEREERFPELLTRVEPRLELVANLGVNGYTTADLIRDELPALAGLAPGFVTLLIGVNDVVQAIPARTYAANLIEIFDVLLAAVPTDRLVAVSIPDYTVTPAGADYGDPAQKRTAIIAANGVMAELCGERGVALVDIFDLSSRAAVERELIANDGLHPSGRQYGLWVERIAPVAARLLDGQPVA